MGAADTLMHLSLSSLSSIDFLSFARTRSSKYSKAQRSSTRHSTPHSTAQHSTAQHSTAQHSTAQHSTAQHSTAQHSTTTHLQSSPTQLTQSVVDGDLPEFVLQHADLPLGLLLQYVVDEGRLPRPQEAGDDRDGGPLAAAVADVTVAIVVACINVVGHGGGCGCRRRRRRRRCGVGHDC
jgi:hypothetical protein